MRKNKDKCTFGKKQVVQWRVRNKVTLFAIEYMYIYIYMYKMCQGLRSASKLRMEIHSILWRFRIKEDLSDITWCLHYLAQSARTPKVILS